MFKLKAGGYRLCLPESFWAKYYREGAPVDSAGWRDQQQLTWVYFNQLDPWAFRDAVASSCFSNSQGNPWSLQGVVNPTRAVFARVAIGTRAYEKFSRWVEDDAWEMDITVLTVDSPEPGVMGQNEEGRPPSLMSVSSSSSSSSSGYSDGLELKNPIMIDIGGVYTLRESEKIQGVEEPLARSEASERRPLRTVRKPYGPPVRERCVLETPRARYVQDCQDGLSPKILNRCTLTDLRNECSHCRRNSEALAARLRAEPPPPPHSRDCRHCRALGQGAILRQGRICYEDDLPSDGDGYCVEQ